MKWPKREKWNELFAFLWEEFLDAVIPRRRLNQRFLNTIGHMTPEELAGWLARGADPNAHTSGWGSCALGRAARSPFTEDDLVARLLEAGADPNALDLPNIEPPLVQAAHSSTDEKICLLLEAGADPSVINTRGLSVLDELTRWAHIETIEKAMDYGASVHLGAPLHFAVYAQRPELIRLFLESGADPHQRDRRWENQLPCEIARELSTSPEKALGYNQTTNEKILRLLSEAVAAHTIDSKG
ncbi:ankyrin repeat domain-containing protein [Armatimonas sp.]|uniref:ankyrin repeat domain-containing protein n=1 Tax=Armatimonas sp. TaxID=1872638 RepID=UPI00286C76C5|nr:ankyrin repeat domain-containing protein [Armatimonas sp.]